MTATRAETGMDDLKRLLHNVKFDDEYDAAVHKNIYSHITKNILENVDQQRECPPVEILVYAVQNILYPDLIRSEIPSLLDLLAHIESVRQRAVKSARAALDWNQYYSTADKRNVLLLAEEECGIVEGIASRENATLSRNIYMTILFKLCELHIRSLWNTNEEQLGEYMREYFPSFTNHQSSRLFQFDLAEDERQGLKTVGKDCALFLRDAAEWESQLEDTWVAEGHPREQLYDNEDFLQDHQREFEEKFPEPTRVDGLSQVIVRYVKKVDGMVDDLEHIFSYSGKSIVTTANIALE